MRHNPTCPRYIHDGALHCTCRNAPSAPKIDRLIGSDPGGVCLTVLAIIAMLWGAYTWSSMVDAHLARQYPATHGVMK